MDYIFKILLIFKLLKILIYIFYLLKCRLKHKEKDYYLNIISILAKFTYLVPLIKFYFKALIYTFYFIILFRLKF